MRRAAILVALACGCSGAPAPPPLPAASVPAARSAEPAEVEGPVSLVIQDGHSSSVMRLAFSPDGRSIVSGSSDHTVRLWDVSTRELRGTLSRHAREVRALAWSPDGARVAVAEGSQPVTLLDPRGIEKPVVLALNEPGGDVYGLAFLRDAGTLAVGGPDGVRLWNVAHARVTHRFDADIMRLFNLVKVIALAASPDGKLLAAASEDPRYVVLLDVASGKDRGVLWPAGAPTSCAFSKSGKLLATCSYAGAEVWEVATRARVATLERADGEACYGAAFGPDDDLLVAAGPGRVAAWDLPSGVRRGVVPAHHDFVFAVAMSPDGETVATGGNDEQVRLWDARTLAPKGVFGAPGRLAFFLFAPRGGAFALGVHDGPNRLCRVEGGRLACTPFGEGAGRTWGIAFSGDGARISQTRGDGAEVLVFDTATGEIEQRLDARGCVLSTFALSRDGARMAAGCNNNRVRIWTRGGLAAGTDLVGYETWVYGVAFSPDGTRLVSGGGIGKTRLWDLAGAAKAKVLESPDGLSDTAVAWSPRGDVIAVGRGAGITLVDAATLRVSRRIDGLEAHQNALAFSPDGARLASAGNDGSVAIWDVARGARSAKLPSMDDPIYALSWDPAGAFLAASGRGVRIYRLADGASVRLDALPVAGGPALLAYTDAGLVDGPPEVLARLRFRGGGDWTRAPLWPIDKVRTRVHRERLLERFLAGETP